jgi:hypothetical protein
MELKACHSTRIHQMETKMTMYYSNPERESDPHALPDLEVFQLPGKKGWYWWVCFPGCLPDSEPQGPFDTEKEALADGLNHGD